MVMFRAAATEKPPRAVAPIQAGSAVWVWSVRSIPRGANKRGEWKNELPLASASRIQKKFQRKQKLSPAPDRKSTRLNSSHGYISYAVFCLKKKTVIIVHSL